MVDKHDWTFGDSQRDSLAKTTKKQVDPHHRHYYHVVAFQRYSWYSICQQSHWK